MENFRLFIQKVYGKLNKKGVLPEKGMNEMKKLIAVILSVVMILTVISPAAVAADGKCDCGVLPTIYVGPLGNTDIYENPGAENEKTLFRPATDTIVKLVLKLVPSLFGLLLFKDYDGFGDSLIDAVNDAMGSMALDGNGNSLPNVDVKIELPTKTEHGRDYQYYFHYDWRLDPVESAGKLDEYIQVIKGVTGHNQVNIKASSMGGVVAMSYFAEYGYEDVAACVFQCCPILGTDVAGDLLSRKVALDGKALLDYGITALPPEDFGGALLNGLFYALYYSGLIDGVMVLGNNLLNNLETKVFDELLTPVFGTILGLWAFVPDHSYEEAKAINLDPETQAGLIAKADYYHYNVQCRADEILNGAIDAGTRIMIVAGYDIQRTPLVESMHNDSDATVDTKYASAGATVALRGEVLESTCEAECGHNHVSPEGDIDASTCILPENTWFLKGMLHSTGHDGIDEFYNWFFYSGEDCNVWTNPAYPQFIDDDKPNNRLIPMGNFAEGVEPPEVEAGDSFHDKYVENVLPVIEKVIGFVEKIR